MTITWLSVAPPPSSARAPLSEFTAHQASTNGQSKRRGWPGSVWSSQLNAYVCSSYHFIQWPYHLDYAIPDPPRTKETPFRRPTLPACIPSWDKTVTKRMEMSLSTLVLEPKRSWGPQRTTLARRVPLSSNLYMPPRRLVTSLSSKDYSRTLQKPATHSLLALQTMPHLEQDLQCFTPLRVEAISISWHGVRRPLSFRSIWKLNVSSVVENCGAMPDVEDREGEVGIGSSYERRRLTAL